MKQHKSPFEWRHFEPTVILLCVRWYCGYQLSYRDLEEMMRERGLTVDHTTVFRWIQRYAPEINKRIRPHLKMSGTSYRLDETYVKVGTEWKYLQEEEAGYFRLGILPTRRAPGRFSFWRVAVQVTPRPI